MFIKTSHWQHVTHFFKKTAIEMKTFENLTVKPSSGSVFKTNIGNSIVSALKTQQI